MRTPTEPGAIDLMATVQSLPGQQLEERADLELTRLEQYVLLHEVGSGGMGVVYAAYDETLDRKVAIKLLHEEEGAQPRLHREAQAMARLSHPNVVPVFETGQTEGRAYIVMEFVDGQTLGRWLRAATRSRAAILAVFRGAAEGLLAAHEQGLVHRDFKPDNVMVRGDGRAMVMDFGVARAGGCGGSSAALDALIESGELSNQLTSNSDITALTKTGTILGTPAYMAPEQFRGNGSEDAQADQFSFCVALWEALFGCRPFAGDSLLTLEQAILDRAYSTPSAHDVPTWLRRVLERGLAPTPDERWPSMRALLDALDDDPTQRRRAGWAAAAMAGALGLVVGALVHAQLDARPSPVRDSEALLLAECAAASSQLEAVWSADARARAREAFLATGFAPAEGIWARTEQTLDAYAEGWTRLRADTCVELGRDADAFAVEAHVDGERIRACLDERAGVFSRVVGSWSADALDNAKVVRAPTAAARLPLLSTCTDETLLELWVPPPTAPADRERVEALRADLDQVVALMLSSNYADALELAEATLSQAEALGWRPLIAEARFSAGDLYEATGDYAKARATLEQAFFEASAVGHDRVAVRTVGKLSWTTGQRLYDHEAALFWADMGDALVERVGLEGTLEQSRIEAGRAAVYMRQSRHDEALELYRSILATREPLLGADDIQVAAILNNIGLVHIQRGDLDEALDSLNRAREIREATLGAGHPEVGGSLNNISLALEGLGRYDEALEAASAALELLEVAFGDAHPTIGASLNNVGYIYYEAGRYDEARRTFEKAVRVKERALGEAHPALTSTLTNLADTLVRLGEHEPARELLVRASGLRAAEDRSHHERGRADFTLARIVWATASADDRRTALGLARSAREHYVDEGSGYADKIAEIDTWLAERD